MVQPGEKISPNMYTGELPLKPPAFTLIGQFVKIVPFDMEKDLNTFYERTNGSEIRDGDFFHPDYDANELIWKHLRWGPFNSADDMRVYLKEIAEKDCARLYAVKQVDSEGINGIIALDSNSPTHRKIEFRFGISSPLGQGTGVAFESVYMLYDHLFKIGYRRVEGWVNVHNTRSLNLQLRYTMTFEGIARKFCIAKDCNVDVAHVRILDFEWKEKKAKVLQRFAPVYKANPKI
jgi:RimJ/RimL family protein N-acetyltransferase